MSKNHGPESPITILLREFPITSRLAATALGSLAVASLAEVAGFGLLANDALGVAIGTGFLAVECGYFERRASAEDRSE